MKVDETAKWIGVQVEGGTSPLDVDISCASGERRGGGWARMTDGSGGAFAVSRPHDRGGAGQCASVAGGGVWAANQRSGSRSGRAVAAVVGKRVSTSCKYAHGSTPKR